MSALHFPPSVAPTKFHLRPHVPSYRYSIRSSKKYASRTQHCVAWLQLPIAVPSRSSASRIGRAPPRVSLHRRRWIFPGDPDQTTSPRRGCGRSNMMREVLEMGSERWYIFFCGRPLFHPKSVLVQVFGAFDCMLLITPLIRPKSPVSHAQRARVLPDCALSISSLSSLSSGIASGLRQGSYHLRNDD